MKTQTDGPMKTNTALELVRGLPGARLQVPRDGYAHKRAIAVALGADHLDKPEDALTDEEHDELDKYVDLIHELAEDHLLISFVKPISLGRGGTTQEEVVMFDIVYTATSNRAISLFGPIRTADDLLAHVRRRGSVQYRTRFERGHQGFLCEIAQACGEDAPRTNQLLDFVATLREANLLEEVVVPFLDTHKASKGETVPNIPAATHTLRAL